MRSLLEYVERHIPPGELWRKKCGESSENGNDFIFDRSLFRGSSLSGYKKHEERIVDTGLGARDVFLSLKEWFDLAGAQEFGGKMR